jgi:hypothetical protein
LKTFFAKFEENAISFKVEKALITEKIYKIEKDIANRIILPIDL